MKDIVKTLSPVGLIAGMALLGATSALAGDGLMGVNVLTYNTFTGAPTENIEMDVGMFGMNNNLFATVADGV